MGLDHRPWWWLPLLGKGSGRDAIGTALVIIGGYLSFVWVFLYCYRIGFIINYRKATFPRVRRARKVTERPSRMKCPILRESIKNHHERFIPFGCPWSLFRSCFFFLNRVFRFRNRPIMIWVWALFRSWWWFRLCNWVSKNPFPVFFAKERMFFRFRGSSIQISAAGERR